jgi:predicted  nucleic acid-binding Zn-ribbon protein
MAEETNWLLTDEFVQFSGKIAAILEKKKAKKAELKAFYDKIQVDLKSLEEEAKQAEEEFQKWRQSQDSKSE